MVEEPDPEQAPSSVGVATVVRLSSLGRTSLYEAMNRGDLPARKSGGRTLIPVEDLRKYVEALPRRTTTAEKSKAADPKRSR